MTLSSVQDKILKREMCQMFGVPTIDFLLLIFPSLFLCFAEEKTHNGG